MGFVHRVWYGLLASVIGAIGNIRISKVFPFLYYDDTVFAVDGERILDAMELVKPGDIILHGFDWYLDSKLIPGKRKYSHAGIVVDPTHVIHAVAPTVSKISIIDFMQCDRVAILRPKSGKTAAISAAKRFLRDSVKYDFMFSRGDDYLYCFELAALCYPNLRIEKKPAVTLGGLVRRKEKVYLSDSFFETDDLKLVYEYNPEFNIDYPRNAL